MMRVQGRRRSGMGARAELVAAGIVEVAVAAAAIGMVVLGGCQRSEDREGDRRAEVEAEAQARALTSVIAVDRARARLRHDEIGHGRFAGRASFVLVDAENRHHSDVIATLGGELVDRAGASTAAFLPTSLRIPAGGVRTFALVSQDRREHLQATEARIEVIGASVPRYLPTVMVTEGSVHRDGDRVVAQGRVQNTAASPVRALVFAGFYDEAGTPMTRPFREVYIPGGDSQVVMFVGPDGSRKGYIFIGDVVY